MAEQTVQILAEIRHLREDYKSLVKRLEDLERKDPIADGTVGTPFVLPQTYLSKLCSSQTHNQTSDRCHLSCWVERIVDLRICKTQSDLDNSSSRWYFRYRLFLISVNCRILE